MRRLAAVDGLRALAALWVVAFHIRAFSGGRLTAVPGLDLILRSGSAGVSLFLVLSGFCLYVPYAGGRLDRFRTGSFLTRRCRRLMPTYYASLVLVVAAYAIFGGRAGLPRSGAGSLAGQAVAHGLLVHQLLPSTFYGLNGAYWSLGLEWELYLTLPLLVVAVRRIGLSRTLAAVVGLNVAYRFLLAGAISHHLVAAHSVMATDVLPNLFLGRWAEFALGMAAAELYRTGRVQAWGRGLRWAALPLAAGALLTYGGTLSHLVFGAVFFCVLCTVLAGDNAVSKALSWRPLAGLGLMSYSLYLVHQPLVQVFAALLGAGHGTSPARVFLELVLLVPVIVLVAWVLFMVVERRSLAPAPAPAAGGHGLVAGGGAR
ncbi:MAG: acyltransferase family protein [Acidimicrobiales bacterium]